MNPYLSKWPNHNIHIQSINEGTRRSDIIKLNSAHYKLLRIAVKDWRNKINRITLVKLGRAKPALWAKYAAANYTIKALRDAHPKRIVKHLSQTLYYERRYPGTPRFFDGSKRKIGKQALGNHVKPIFDEIKVNLTWQESTASIRLMLKKSLKFEGYANTQTLDV